ncbi:MAG: NAD(P)-binding protein [Steroidobacterales bacterium]
MIGDGITRREFLDGFACSIIAGVTAPGSSRAQGSPATYPPGRTGYVGSRPADFAIAHGVRDGRRYQLDGLPVAEHYDVVIVGAGIGGLATAHYLRKLRPAARMLVLDNHDDFGGHARRNEFNVDGRFLLGYGGSESMDAPKARWTSVARDCVASLGVPLERFEQAFHLDLYPGMGLSSGLFFPREIYGVDRLVTGDPVRSLPTDVPAARHNARPAAAFVADCPVDDAQKARLIALYTDRRDVLAGHSREAKLQLLQSTSYRDYLARYFGLDERSLAMFGGRTFDLWASKTDGVPAMDAWACQYPGFQGLGLPSPKEAEQWDSPYIYHFPDGNASLARLFVRQLIPGVAPGQSMDDIVTAGFDYGRLDRPDQAVRLRLSSTVVDLSNRRTGVELVYVQGEALTRIAATHAVYAGYSKMLPYICRDLGDAQRAALSDQVRAPMAYVNVALRNWRAWVRQGVHYVNNPAGFYSNLKLDYPVSLGDYRFPTHPDEPMILHLVHVSWPEGSITDLRSAWLAGRALLYQRTFEEFESHARDELTRILGPGGFEADRDIAAITVNRWGHGYAYEPVSLFDPHPQREIRLSSARLGRIHFAGTDAAWMAYADRAIDTAHRVAGEIAG